MKNTARHSVLRFAFFPLLLSIHLIVGCNNSPDAVVLRDSPPPPRKDLGNTTDEKPTTPPVPPIPPNPEDGPQPSPTPEPTATPAPTPAAGKVARFICESEVKNTRSLNTLRGDVISHYTMPSLIPYINGRKGQFVKSPIPLQSDGVNVFFILRAQEDDLTPWKIYKATGNLLTSNTDLQVISQYQGVPPKGGYAYENLKLDRRILGANLKRSAYVYPGDNGTYLWESLKGTKFPLPFNANASFNPTFLASDDYLRFDQERDKGPTLTQKFYHFDTKKTFSLPTPADSKDSQLFGYINAQKNIVFWVEGRPEGQWKLRSMALTPQGKVMNLGILPGNPGSLRLPIALIDFQGETLVAYNEEQVDLDKNAQPYLKTSVIHLVKASAQLGKILTEETIPYSEELRRTATTPQSLKEGILGGLFLEPLSGKLYSSVLSAGGLASFDLTSGTWETHGMIAKVYGCLSPEWGVEVINE